MDAVHAGLYRLTLVGVLLSFAGELRAEPGLDCELDDALSEAAAELLLRGGTPSAAQLTAAVHAVGSDDVALHALLTRGDDVAARKRWLEDLRAHADAPLRCGAADGEHGSLLIATAKGGALSPIDPVRRRVRGRLSSGFSRAELVLSDANGTLLRLGVSVAELERGVALSSDLVLPMQVQLVASGPAGPRPVAERTIALTPRPREAAAEASDQVGEASGDSMPSTAPSPPPTAAAPDPAPAETLAALLVQLRRVHDRLPLRDNRLLRRAATNHARDVCEQGRLAHELGGRDPEARVADVGLSARLVGEVIARADGSQAALDALLGSPSHRLTLLEPRFTDVGVGASLDRSGKRCFVVLLCAWPRYMGRAAGR